MSEPTTELIRKVYGKTGYLVSHHEECWFVHAGCCIRMLCDRLDARDKRIAELEAEVQELEELARHERGDR